MEFFYTDLILLVGTTIPQESVSDQEEANFEIQFNLNNDSFRIVHGQLGSNFLQPQPNNAMVGFTKDISCLTLNEDISNCEGKDYVQLYFHDGHLAHE